MESTPDISVMMPVYNSSKFLPVSINSILCQSYENFELLVLNDGSTDNSEEIILNFKDPRIRYFTNTKNMGLSYTRNRLIELSKGKYLSILDSDDVAEPRRLEIQKKFLDKNPDFSLVGSWIQPIDEEGNPFGDVWKFDYPEQEIKVHLLFHNCFAQSSVMMNRAFLTPPYYREEYPPAEDFDLWIRLAEKGKEVNIPEVLTKYRIHAMGTTSLNNKKLVEAEIIIFRDQLDKLGIDFIQEDLFLHHSISRKCEYQFSLMKYYQWFNRLNRSNKRSGRYDQLVFTKVIKDVQTELFLNYVRKKGYSPSVFYAELISNSNLFTNWTYKDKFRFMYRCFLKRNDKGWL